jgi:hypothetical protein
MLGGDDARGYRAERPVERRAPAERMPAAHVPPQDPLRRWWRSDLDGGYVAHKQCSITRIRTTWREKYRPDHQRTCVRASDPDQVDYRRHPTPERGRGSLPSGSDRRGVVVHHHAEQRWAELVVFHHGQPSGRRRRRAGGTPATYWTGPTVRHTRKTDQSAASGLAHPEPARVPPIGHVAGALSLAWPKTTRARGLEARTARTHRGSTLSRSAQPGRRNPRASALCQPERGHDRRPFPWRWAH